MCARIAADRLRRGIVRIVEQYDPSLPQVRGRPRPADPGVPEPGQERRRGGAGRRAARSRWRPPTSMALRLAVPGSAARAAAADHGRGARQRPGRARGHGDASVRALRHAPSATAAGLGLALVAKIVADHGGVIESDSRPSRRTIFRVLLPAARRRQDAGRQREGRHDRRDSTPGRRRRPRRSARCSARRWRGRATRCRRPASPRRSGAGSPTARATSSSPTWSCRTRTALDLLPRIRKLRPDLPVIVMSAQNTLLTAVKAAERGAFEYLPKPFDLDESGRGGAARAGQRHAGAAAAGEPDAAPRSSCRSSAARRRCRRSTASSRG